MALPDVILEKDQALVTLSAAPNGIAVNQLNGMDLRFGYVEMVSDANDFVEVGQYVLFNKRVAPSFFYGSTQYYLVSEYYLRVPQNLS